MTSSTDRTSPPWARFPISSAASSKLRASPASAGPEAFFLPLGGTTRFCLLHQPRADAARRGAVLYVHPFAEEMNRCRRMAALQSRALADAGWLVLQVDLFGCGDSAGEFGDATWARWIDDVVESAAWLTQQSDAAPVLWGLRTGALLAREAAVRSDVSGFVLWQPVLSGKQFLEQFLRLKAAREMVAQGERDRSWTRALREQLDCGEPVEVAGYAVSAALALGLEASELDAPARSMRVAWLEVSRSPSEVRPASRTRIEHWIAAKHEVHAVAVEGPQFWQTLDITEAPALVAATLSAIDAW